MATAPCPICFEIEDSCELASKKVTYTSSHNHSWSNSNRCDGHDICWSCLAKHLYVQVMEEGRASVRCPGLGCSYRLLNEDVARAVARGQADAAIVERLETLQSQSGEARLKEIVDQASKDRSSLWLLEESQPCPKCLVLARRETGCNHIVCRCGCRFCFRCGGPFEDFSCACEYIDCFHGEVAFAAWLRSSEYSPCAWLWESWEAEQHHFVNTLGFFLWLAGARVKPPHTWLGDSGAHGVLSEIAPISWSSSDSGEENYWPEFYGWNLHEFWDYYGSVEEYYDRWEESFDDVFTRRRSAGRSNKPLERDSQKAPSKEARRMRKCKHRTSDRSGALDF